MKSFVRTCLMFSLLLAGHSAYAANVYLNSGEHFDLGGTRVYCESRGPVEAEYKCAVRICVKDTVTKTCKDCNFFSGKWSTDYKFVLATSASLANNKVRQAGTPFSNLACWDPDTIKCTLNE